MSEPTFPDPRDEYAFTIVHSPSGDEAYADTIQGAHVAQVQLVHDAGGGSAAIIHRTEGWYR